LYIGIFTSIFEPVVTCSFDSETANDYKQLAEELMAQEFVIQGVTIDGKRGVAKAFGSIPVQMCHFHQIAIIKRYLTRKPKLEASIELLKLCRRIPTSTQTRFADALSQWHGKYGAFLNEKTINPTTGKLSPTHAKLASAYRSLITNLPYLFTYKNHKEFGIPNTTNSLDGGVFSQLKKTHQTAPRIGFKKESKIDR
jgi:hypothetical protein